jgi:hypothetical protein
MATVSEIIPEALQPEVDAALAWFNSTQADEFEVTGILDADLTIEADAPRELRLVLCGGDTCEQRSFRVARVDAGFDVAEAASGPAESDVFGRPQAELDPPPGPRRGWLDSALAKHSFVVLIFYRGFW